VRLSRLNAQSAGSRLLDFEKKTKLASLTGDAARYIAAESQTDNIVPQAHE